jgi:uncharacterized membrane protein YfcA
MEQTAALALLLAVILALLAGAPQRILRNALRHETAFIVIAPLSLTAIFGAAAALVDAESLRLLLMVLV